MCTSRCDAPRCARGRGAKHVLARGHIGDCTLAGVAAAPAPQPSCRAHPAGGKSPQRRPALPPSAQGFLAPIVRGIKGEAAGQYESPRPIPAGKAASSKGGYHLLARSAARP